MDLREQLAHCLQGRVCFVGVGNSDFGDDAFGVVLARELQAAGVGDVIEAGANPERWMGRLEGFDHVVLLDAVEFGAAPGSVVFMDAAEIAARYPQVSTHKISLGLLARWIEADRKTQAWLIGAQPQSLKAGRPLTTVLQSTLEAMRDVLVSLRGGVAAPAVLHRVANTAAGGMA